MRTLILLFGLIISQCCFAQQHWDSLGMLNMRTTVLYGDSVTNKLYVCGQFSRVNGEIIRGVATWDGTQLDSVGHGIDYDTIVNIYPGNSWAMVRRDSCLYLAGGFRRAGYVNSQFLTRWNGSAWDSIPGGQPNDVVDGMILYNNDIYISGVFDSVGSVAASGIAKWNGASWSAIGNNFPFVTAWTGAVYQMEFYHGNLFVAGNFYDPQGNLCYLAKWDGVVWQFLGADLQCGFGGVADMTVYNDELYVSGFFVEGGGNVATSIMRWNDTLWRDVNGSVQFVVNNYPMVQNMTVHNGKLYCVGNFEMIGNVPALGLASWDGTTWCGYGTDFTFQSQYAGAGCIGFFRDTLYVGGNFREVNGDTIKFVAQWVGGSYVDTCGTAVGIPEAQTLSSSVLVYPNPSNTIITFQFSNDASREIIITDQLGREIWRQESNDNAISISVSDFADGIYFYSIQDAEGSKANGKFVVAH